MPSGDLVRRAAERAAEQPFFLASSLLPYARAEQLDHAALAAHLGCAADHLPALLLCRRPTGEGLVFRKDVEVIAQRFSLEAARLAQVIRAADAVVALQRIGTNPSEHLLAAARDRLDPDDHPDGTNVSGPRPRLPATEVDQ